MENIDTYLEQIKNFQPQYKIPGTRGMNARKFVLENNPNLYLLNDFLFLDDSGKYSRSNGFIWSSFNSFEMDLNELKSLRFGGNNSKKPPFAWKANYEDKREGFYQEIKCKEKIIFPLFTRNLVKEEMGGNLVNLKAGIIYEGFFEDLKKINFLKKEYYLKEREYSEKLFLKDLGEFFQFFSEKGVSGEVLDNLKEDINSKYNGIEHYVRVLF